MGVTDQNKLCQSHYSIFKLLFFSDLPVFQALQPAWTAEPAAYHATLVQYPDLERAFETFWSKYFWWEFFRCSSCSLFTRTFSFCVACTWPTLKANRAANFKLSSTFDLWNNLRKWFVFNPLRKLRDTYARGFVRICIGLSKINPKPSIASFLYV